MFPLISGNRKKLSDHELLERYSSTEDLSFLGELYSRYMHLVYGLCLKYLGNREESKDAVMQIFEILTVKLLNQNIRHFKNWLYVISKNYCLMQIRSEQAREKRNILWTADFMESEPELHPIDETGKEVSAILRDCIENLKEEQKKCIKLFYFENKCYQEIAHILNLDEKKVKSHLQNGKRNLKICLENRNVKKGQTY